MRIGQGWDMHRFGADRPLRLAGVEVASESGGLIGHSDADVLSHAVASALLGSLALGDLGQHFPDDDPRYKGADGVERFCQELVEQSGVLLLPASVYRSELTQTPNDRFRIGYGRANTAAGLDAMREHLAQGGNP